MQLNYEDPRYAEAAREILRRHDDYDAEANITSALRHFLVLTGLAASEEIQEETPPGEGSRHAVDLATLDTLIEVKRRIGSVGGMNPNPAYVEQLDGYLAESANAGRGVRTGILTDGKHWLLRWPGAGEVRTVKPYAFTLDSHESWVLLYEWLRDRALFALEGLAPDRANIEEHLGPNSPSYEREIAALSGLFRGVSDTETVGIKRRLWLDLLRAALGEIAVSPEQLDGLFVRHTYLSMVIGMVVQASFGIDIRRAAENEPADLLQGRTFRNTTGLQGVVGSDFFTWPAEVTGASLIQALARRIARFDWGKSPPDVAAALYETVIPPEERRTLGEYYTPDWLARVMVRELVTDPLNQRVLDPACGSGTFVAQAVSRFLEAASEQGRNLHPKEVLNRLLEAVTGIDIHPVAVHLARAAWVLAARPAIRATVESGVGAAISVPVYLGDALQLRFQAGDMFAEHTVSIQVGDEENTDLVFPVSLVERSNDFDRLMSAVADAIEGGEDPSFALDDTGITDPGEREVIGRTIKTLQRLHKEGRNHIWAYYTRNLVRPVALARSKVDVIVGNPPWLNYNQTASVLRTELRRQSERVYGIWKGGRYATHQDVAGLFFARSVDLYLKDGGTIGMVMPHSALQAGQYSEWRTGTWRAKPVGRGKNRAPGRVLAVDFSHKTAWDLERLEPNTFFPVPASVVFARRIGVGGGGGRATPLAGEVESWSGAAGPNADRSARTAITDTSAAGGSPYAGMARQGATIVPRCLFFVEETESTAIVQAGLTTTVNPRRGSQDKEPWRSLDLARITGQAVETEHVFDVHLGETIVPYATLPPLKAALPLRRSDLKLPVDPSGTGGLDLGGLKPQMRGRWRTVSELWEQNKAAANRLDLAGQLDYFGKLSAQLEWQRAPGDRPVRVVYSSSGQPTASLLDDRVAVVDYTLFWIACKDAREASYLQAVINSKAMYEAVTPLMPKGQFGARHLQKHLWKLPIPEFDPGDALHVELADAGEAAALGAAARLAEVRRERSRVTVTIARRELRRWLQASPEGAAVEAAVARLLA